MLRTKHNRNIDTLFYVQKAIASLSKMWYILQRLWSNTQIVLFWQWKANSISVLWGWGFHLFFPFGNAYCRMACCFLGSFLNKSTYCYSTGPVPDFSPQNPQAFLIFTKYLCWQLPRQAFFVPFERRKAAPVGCTFFD